MKELILQATIFHELTKISYVRKIPGGYGVFSHKGKLLGKYKTKELANKRLRQIEFWKHKNASTKTYTSIVRSINENGTPEISNQFKKIFKKVFDQALLDDESNPEQIALKKAIEYLNQEDSDIIKQAAPIQMGEPEEAGKFIAAVIHFLMRRISPENRNKSMINLKNKISNLDESSIASTKMPAGSAIGQSILLSKHILFGQSPQFVRNVLDNIVRNL